MESPCPHPEVLATYREGRLPEEERDTFEAHASACPSCQDLILLIGLAGASGSPARVIFSRRTSRWAWAAAASLLIACGAGGLWTWSHEGGSRIPPQARIPSGDATQSFLAPGVDLLAAAGASFALSQDGPGGDRLHVKSGTLWIDVRRERPLRIEVPGGTLDLSSGSLALVLPAPASPLAALSGLLLPGACAGEAGETASGVWVLDGEVLALDSIRVGAGNRLEFTAQGPRAEPAPEAGLEVLRRSRAAAASRLQGSYRTLAPQRLEGAVLPLMPRASSLPRTWRWILVLSGRGPQTEVELTLPSGGSWRRWTPGLASGPAPPREVLEISWDGDRLRALRDGAPFLSCTAGEVERALPLAAPGWSLTAWSGPVVLESCTLEVQP